MEQVIYGDIYLIVNFTMDYLALYLTATAIKHPHRPLRTSIAAALGAIYSLLSLFLPDHTPLSFFTTAALPFLLILITFHAQASWRELLRATAAFWVISFLLGGAATAVSYLLGNWAKREALIGGQVEALPGELPYWGILLIALIAGAILTRLLRGHRKLPSTAILEAGEEESSLVRLSGMIDSGNLLVEPLSGAAVILVDRSVASFLPPELAFLATGEPPVLTPRLRLIPYSTPSGEGLLYAYLPRVVKINGKLRNACIAIADLPSEEETGKVILPASIL